MENNREIISATISLLSSKRIIEISSGEVKKAKTIDAVTGKPVKDGLFCQRIFGPVERGVCGCGKFHPSYKKKKNLKCSICEVHVQDPLVRRRRIGHIKLKIPVVHIWYRQIIASLLGLRPSDLNALTDYMAFMVLKSGDSPYKQGEVISIREYETYKFEVGKADKKFQAEAGGPLIKHLLERVKIDELYAKYKKRPPSRRVNKKLLLLRKIRDSMSRPECMVLDYIVVLPPDLRPVLTFDDGNVASSDLNELYAKVIHRNNRLKTLYEEGAPEIIITPGNRLLQSAVDALIANGKKIKVTDRSGKRVLKSLAAMVEKKGGMIRRNLLGKRVDYSGRSAITAGPDLKLHQCGLPLDLAMEIFKPFVYGRLMRMGYAYSLEHAKFMAERRHWAALNALDYVLQENIVILNRAPSLHRMSMQAFTPVIIKGRAIRLHPLTCSAFNADFDGDQMGVHVPVTVEAQIEARILMMSVNNILSPASGKVNIAPSQDMVLGLYFLTKDRASMPGEGKIFADKEEALVAHDQGIIDLQSLIKVRMRDEFLETTPGRLLFSEIVPPEVPFRAINKTMKKKDLSKLLDTCYDKAGKAATVILADNLKDMGFRYATMAAISFSISDVTIPKEKHAIIEATERQVGDIISSYNNGEMTDEEKHNKVVDAWVKASNLMADSMMETFGIPEDEILTEAENKDRKEFNSLYMMADSGARGSKEQFRQLAAMRGLMAKPNGEIVEIPIKSNLKEGLSYHEYLLACHGARKGRADGALKTANAGYFTRRLVDCAHDVVINDRDCGTVAGFRIAAVWENDNVVVPLVERITGRVAAKTVRHPVTKEILVHQNEIITQGAAAKVTECGIQSVEIRSPVTCGLREGICSVCYGHDLSRRDFPEIGDAVGIIAAQSIGEPGTQLTLRTFHGGGTATGSGMNSSISSKHEGLVRFREITCVTNRHGKKIVVGRGGRIAVENNGIETDAGAIPYGSTLLVEDNSIVEAGIKLAEWDPFSAPLIATVSGSAKFEGIKEGSTVQIVNDPETGLSMTFVKAMHSNFIPRIRISEKEYYLPIGAIILVRNGDKIVAGDMLAKVPKKSARNADITGGLARVLQVLELRKLKDPAVMADIDGEVRIHPPKGNSMKMEIIGETGNIRTSIIGIERHPNVYNGDRVKAGDILVDGTCDINDILKILGPHKTALYVMDEVQKVYRSQGVEVNDKHFEIILRKMLAKVKVLTPGSTDLVTGEILSKWSFFDENNRTEGEKATAAPVILSLTKSALMSESWLSAASFQNTASVLAEAALFRSKDLLRGTKENIIIGNTVPIGTGHKKYKDTVLVKDPGERIIKNKNAYRAFMSLFKE